MSFTTWVRAQDAFGQFDVRKGDALREGVALVKDYPEYVGQVARPGKPFVNTGIAAAEGYKGLLKDALLEEIDRRNEFAVLEDDVIQLESDKPTIAQLTSLLKADDKAREEAAAAAAKAAGVEPTNEGDDDSQTSDAQTSDTGETTTTTTDASTGAESE